MAVGRALAEASRAQELRLRAVREESEARLREAEVATEARLAEMRDALGRVAAEHDALAELRTTRDEATQAANQFAALTRAVEAAREVTAAQVEAGEAAREWAEAEADRWRERAKAGAAERGRSAAKPYRPCSCTASEDTRPPVTAVVSRTAHPGGELPRPSRRSTWADHSRES